MLSVAKRLHEVTSVDKRAWRAFSLCSVAWIKPSEARRKKKRPLKHLVCNKGHCVFSSEQLEARM